MTNDSLSLVNKVPQFLDIISTEPSNCKFSEPNRVDMLTVISRITVYFSDCNIFNSTSSVKFAETIYLTGQK